MGARAVIGDLRGGHHNAVAAGRSDDKQRIPAARAAIECDSACGNRLAAAEIYGQRFAGAVQSGDGNAVQACLRVGRYNVGRRAGLIDVQIAVGGKL